MFTSVHPVRLNRQHEKNNAPVKPTKSNPNAGAVVQRDPKMDVVNADQTDATKILYIGAKGQIAKP